MQWGFWSICRQFCCVEKNRNISRALLTTVLLKLKCHDTHYSERGTGTLRYSRRGTSEMILWACIAFTNSCMYVLSECQQRIKQSLNNSMYVWTINEPQHPQKAGPICYTESSNVHTRLSCLQVASFPGHSQIFSHSPGENWFLSI